MENNKNFSVKSKNSKNLFYKFITVYIYYYKKKLNFVPEIPLVITLLWDFFKTSVVPGALQNDLYTFFLPETPFLAIDQLKQHFFLITENSLRNCIQTDTLYFCKQNTPVLVLQANENCEAIMFSLPEKIPDSCDHRIINKTTYNFIYSAFASKSLFICLS